MKKHSTLKKHIKSLMKKLKFWIKEIVVWSFYAFLLLIAVFYLDTSEINIAITVTAGFLLFFFLFYIHGTFNYNFPSPLCKTKVEGRIIDSIDDLESGPGDGVDGFLYSYIVTVEYKHKNKTYKRIMKTFGDTTKVDEIFICKFFPKLVHIKFSKDSHLS